MAEKIIKVPLDELQTIRFICKRQGCGGVVEFPTARLTGPVGLTCPSCNQPFPVSQIGSIGGLRALGMAITNLTGNNDFEVEFVVPDPN